LNETCDPPGSPAGGNGNLCGGACTVCGDGIVNDPPIEECDDGNGIDDDGCRNDCTIPVCGDGIVDGQNGETCDPPGSLAGGNGNNCTVTCTSCGDGVVQPGEECDDGNGIDDDDCRNDCTIPVCGDGILDDGETCDPPGSPAGGNGNNCDSDCTVCGDSIVDADEECDDGNAIDDDDCRNDCTIPVCGDGIVDGQDGETCDPPGSPAGGNGNNCDSDCTVCGDGVVDAGEECDDGNGLNTDGCRNDCTIRVCGDGIVDAQNGETCDPPGSPAGGNGNICGIDCTVCGDGVVDAGEECDDGNGADNDDCRNDCTVRMCGDGIVDAGNGETCDPPGSPAGGNGNNCRPNCTACGDGATQAGEQCDDGNGNNADGCRNNCTIPACGDGIVDAGETCDPPGSPAGGNGNMCRANCTVCGDGVDQAGELCDDGNGVEDDGCNNGCTLPEEQVEEPVPAVGAAGMAALLLMLLGGVVLTSRRRRGPVHGS
jgi:cysteine-rich repeat protein